MIRVASTDPCSGQVPVRTSVRSGILGLLSNRANLSRPTTFRQPR
jgi:hypothetical protein